MGLETKLVQKLSQSLLMTPQLQQAIKLLAMGQLEFREAIEQELLENPILEESREPDREPLSAQDAPDHDSGSDFGNGDPSTSFDHPDSSSEGSAPLDQSNEKSPVDWENYLEHLTDARGAATPRGLIDHEDRPSLEATLTKGESLVEHVVSQLRHSEIGEHEVNIAFQILGNLNKDGYLCSSYEEIAQECECDMQDVEKVVGLFRSFDPPGIAARDLSECLLIQLENMGLGEGLEARIVKNHLDKIEKRKYDLIAKLEQVAVEAVYKAVSAIQNLEPRPARNFSDESARYILPDIYVEKVSGEYVITLNEDGLPKLRISPYYLKLLQAGDQANLPNKSYLNERLKAASWLIKSIHQRQNTIFRVTESIVKFQRDFLDYGIDRLKPLVLKDVADDIGMHESTVSRVTTNKYVHTPQGIFELKFFFTSGIKTAGGDVSSSTVKEKIRTLVAAEQPDNPVSDQQIVEILKKENNIEIARRTVAKYREGMNILSSSKRKKLF